MSNILELTKVLIKNNVFAFNGKKKKGKEVSTKGSAIGFALLILFCGACIGVPMIYLLNDLLKDYNVSELLLSFVIPFGGITSIVFGVFSIISVFYFSKDSVQLLHLPIKSSELLVAKFLASLVSEYLILVMFILPLIIGVGVGVGATFVYYIYSSIIFILMPIIPSAIMSIILMLANKVFNFGKKKDLFMYIMTGFILLFAFAYSFGLEFFMSEDSSTLLLLMSGDFSEYINISRYIFPFFNSATYALVNYQEFIGVASLMTFIGLNILFMIILYFVGDKLYVKGLINNSGRKQEKKVSIENTYKHEKGGVIKELIKKEWLIIKRSPVFMLNVVIINLIFPVIFGVSFLFGFSSEGIDISILTELIDYSNSGIFLICIGALLFLCSMTSSCSSSISRDGASAKFSKIIPVSLKKQLDAKVYFSMILDLSMLVIMEIILFILLKAPWYYFVIVNIPLILILFICNYLALILDLRRPRLEWSEESEAVKQNFNVFLSMMLNIVLAAVFIVLGVYLISFDINIYLLFGVISVVLLVMCVLLMFLVNKYQSKLFSKVG